MNFPRIKQKLREGGATEEEIEDHMDYLLDRDRVEDVNPSLCPHCGRTLEDPIELKTGLCTSDDCPHTET